MKVRRPDRAIAFFFSHATRQARLVGGATSGVMELFLFHPVDVCAKRLMSNQSAIAVPGDRAATKANFNKVVFREAADASALQKWKAMFPGAFYTFFFLIFFAPPRDRSRSSRTRIRRGIQNHATHV